MTAKVVPSFDGERKTLGDVVVPDSEVPEQFFIADDVLKNWIDLRAAKSIERTTRDGFSYKYSEGAMPWPDPLDKPARTILTGEGGSGASRMKHAVLGESGRYRRLVPDELDQIQMFPKGWTDTGMTDGHRAFCMGNALVVGIPHEIGKAIASKRFRRTMKEKEE
ncbi:MAG: DNA cytosine methyltransferase [Bifidobacterium choerinum]